MPPSDIAKLKKQAAQLEGRMQFDEALALYRQILDAGEDMVDVALFARAGDLFLRQGNVGDAVTYYEKAVDLYANGGLLDNAIALCNKILRLDPGRTTILYKLARVSAMKGFWPEARANYLEYADCMSAAGQLDEAFRALRELADRVPDQDDVRLTLAERLAASGRGDEALEELRTLYAALEAEGRQAEASAVASRMRAIDSAAEPRSSPPPSGDSVREAASGIRLPDERLPPRRLTRSARRDPAGGTAPQPPAAGAAAHPPAPPSAAGPPGGILGKLRGLFGARPGMGAGPADRPPDSPAPHEVAIGASAPRSVGRGDEFTARFVAYLPREEGAVRQLLTDLSPRSASHLGVHTLTWRVGMQVAVRVSGRGLRVHPEVRSFAWGGKREVLEFDVLVANDARPGATCVLRYDVAVGEVVVATLRMDLEIRDDRGVGEARTSTVSAPRSAFASYASSDRNRVLDRVSALRAVAGIDVFVDHLSMAPGEKWKDRIRQEIMGRELFLLFWSARARESEWVTWEWRTALAERGIDVIRPQPLEPVAAVPAPPELAELHFGDYHLFLQTLSPGGT